MSEHKLPFGKWVYILIPAGIAVFLFYISSLDLKTLGSLVSKTNWILFALAFGCVLGAVTCNTLSWHQLLKDLKVRTSFRRVFKLSWVGIFVDAIVPGGWSGDIFKSYLLSKDHNIAGAKVAASAVLKNVLELIVTLGALITGIVLLSMNYLIEAGILLTIGSILFLIALPLLITVYLSTNLGAAERLIKGIKRLWVLIRGKQANTSVVEGKLRNSLQEFHDGIMAFKTNPRSLVRPMAFQVLAWAFEVLALFFVFASLGYLVSPDKVIITDTLVIGLQTQGVAFAGFTQMVSSTIYTVLGITPILAVASSLLAGVASFWFKMVVSFFAFQRTVLSSSFSIRARFSRFRRGYIS